MFAGVFVAGAAQQHVRSLIKFFFYWAYWKSLGAGLLPAVLFLSNAGELCS